jgi:dienelactone hydrolase
MAPHVLRRRLIAVTVLLLAAAAVALIAASALSGTARHRSALARRSAAGPAASDHAAAPRPARFGVGLQIVRYVDASRTATYADGESGPRQIVTEIRYPTLADGVDIPYAAPARGFAPFPLLIFGHGFAVTPALYSRLLQSWASAGFVVAAPVFPVENADAPGGPDEADLTNQPGDMSFVITKLLAASASSSGTFAGLISPTEIAVSGQSDGGDTALAVAYNATYRDPRVKAAVILSGEEMPGVGGFTFPPGSPALLATQGTDDTINLPARTEEFFARAQRPKYLLRLLGAEHLPPYSQQEPQLSIVARVSTEFLRGYLEHAPADLLRLPALGNVPEVSSLTSQP